VNDPREGHVLLDALAGQGERFDVSFLERNLHPVTVCHGPTAGRVGPLLGGDDASCTTPPTASCSNSTWIAASIGRSWSATAKLKPDIPIRVVVRAGQAERHAAALAGVPAWRHDPTAADLDGFAAEVEAADRYVQATQSLAGEGSAP